MLQERIHVFTHRSGMVQWLGYLALTQEARVRFPVPEFFFFKFRTKLFQSYNKRLQTFVFRNLQRIFLQYKRIIKIRATSNLQSTAIQVKSNWKTKIESRRYLFLVFQITSVLLQVCSGVTLTVPHFPYKSIHSQSYVHLVHILNIKDA